MKISNKIIPVTVILGWIFLLLHIFTSPFKFEFKWVFIYLSVMPIISICWVALMWLFQKLSRKKIISSEYFMTQTNQEGGLRFPWFLYTPGEDGFCLVPLAYTGINYFTAGLSAFIFGLLHYPRYPGWACIPKGLFFFVLLILFCLIVAFCRSS